jgi:ATP-dependent Clp protease ATP-binding subunit ClpA
VLENPLRVIVLDEIEKAHRDLRHCLYDILDTASGREKSSGKNVDFSGCVFFATCNAGIEVRQAAPELVLEAVERNEEFKQYGVRQLGAYIKERTSDAIVEACRKGIKAVELVVDKKGHIEVKPCA